MKIILLLSDEIADLIDELQEYTEKAMKIEMAPWIESYTVDMEDLYTELSLEQIENKPTGPISEKLDNYAQLFTEQETTDQQETSSVEKISNTSRRKAKKRKGKKILAKGDPGTGKSTFGKKIAYDWAKGEFTAVSVVLFVSMKMATKAWTIESVIIKQNPRIESLDITEEKLHKSLKDLGSRCLIILDGLDEYDMQDGDDFYKIIEGRKLPHCTLLVTTRPHNCEQIEKHFSAKVKINGFTKTQAEQFASKCLNNREKMQVVCELNERNFLSEDSYCSPMLLLFLCVLENSDELDLTKKVMSLGQVYFRLIRCMYRKYCARKGIKFSDNEFIQVLRRVGKVAWEMLDSGTNVAEQSQIIGEIGGDAFEYGWFAGHIEYRLASKETKDIFVAFIHQTVQEFLGVFYFISMWNTEGKISISDKYSPTESYFLRFGLWLLSDKCSYIQFDKSENILNALAQYVRDIIDIPQLYLNMLYFMFPVLAMRNSEERDYLLFEFMKKVLSLCEKSESYM